MLIKSALALLVALLAVLFTGPLFIRQMKQLQYGQQIRDDGPASHTAKAGTPTMGGVLILLAAAVAAVIFSFLYPATYIILLVMLGCGLIGFVDDYLKIVRHRSLGLRARAKLLGQVFTALLFIAVLLLAGLYDPAVRVPFSAVELNLGYLYPLFIVLLVLAATNAVNLTDGVDGLAAGTSVLALAAFLVIAIWKGEWAVVVVSAGLIGSLLGFLIFNRHPARLFMGDVGSLGLGGAFAALAVVTKTELFLLIIGGIFVVETISVIAQVISYQLTGKRILLMSPLHHHFELKGWSEWRVVLSFWSAAALFALLGLIAYR